MGKKSLSKSKEVLVDEEASHSVIENREFVAMRAAEMIWPIPTITEDQLRDLVKNGLI
jgi:reverse gyrase